MQIIFVGLKGERGDVGEFGEIGEFGDEGMCFFVNLSQTINFSEKKPNQMITKCFFFI